MCKMDYKKFIFYFKSSIQEQIKQQIQYSTLVLQLFENQQKHIRLILLGQTNFQQHQHCNIELQDFKSRSLANHILIGSGGNVPNTHENLEMLLYNTWLCHYFQK